VKLSDVLQIGKNKLGHEIAIGRGKNRLRREQYWKKFHRISGFMNQLILFRSRTECSNLLLVACDGKDTQTDESIRDYPDEIQNLIGWRLFLII
jgi:hypothetical protein